MKLFNKDKTSKKLINKNALKRGGFWAGAIAVVIAVVILLNIGFSLMDSRGYLKIDLTATKDNTISQENEEFLKGVDQKVDIKVLCSEADYTTTLPSYLANQAGIAIMETDYFEQTISLLKGYEEINSKIEVQYIDYNSALAKEIFDDNAAAFIGDLFVTATDKDGNQKSKLVSYDKIYLIEEDQSYMMYGYSGYIAGNDLETALTSTINSLVNGEDEIMGIITAHTSQNALSFFETAYAKELEYNGFTTKTIDDTVIESIPEDVSVLAIVMPDKDYLESEIEVISKWLDNNGKKGRSVMFLPNTSMDDMPILDEFLEEWGISYGEGMLYQTDKDQYSSGYPTFLYSYTEDNSVAAALNEKQSAIMLSDRNLPITATYETNGTRTVNVITSTGDATTVAPAGAAEDWKPSDDAKTAVYPTVVVTDDSVTVDGKVLSSYVVAFSSYELVYNYGGDFANLELSINAARYVSGMDTSSQMLFVTRKIESETFEGEVTESAAGIIRWIFMGIIPVALIAAGFTVWILRRKK